jgi:hypothetical protein
LDSHGVASLRRGQSYRAASDICETRKSWLEFLSLGLRKNPEKRKITQHQSFVAILNLAILELQRTPGAMKATLEVVAEASSRFAKSALGVVRNNVKVAPFKTLVVPALNSTNVEAARNEPYAADR